MFQVVSGGSSIAGGAIAVDTARKEHDVTIARSDAMLDKAALAKLAAMDEDDMQRIRKLLEQVQQSSSMIFQSLADLDQTAMKAHTTI